MTPIFTDGTSCHLSVKILIFNPNYDEPIEFPSSFIGGQIVSTRSINLGSSSLSIPIKMNLSYPVKIGGIEENIPFNQLFAIHSVIHLLVSRNGNKYRKLNAGVIASRSISVSPGKFQFQFNLKSLEHFIQENEIFFDLNSVDESGQTRASENIEGSISGMANMLKESKNIKDTIEIMWDELLCKFLLGKVLGGAKKFGGVNVIAETNSDSKSLFKLNVTKNSFTENFIHITQFMSSVNVGQTINLMDIMKSYSSAPMYEIFVDSLESIGSENSNPDNASNLSYNLNSNSFEKTYRVKDNECVLVFRQTPFAYFDKEGKWDNSKNPFYKIEFGEIKKINTQESTEDYKSGVHVSLSVYESASLIINYPKYNSTLMKIFGKKILHCKLQGLNSKKDPTISEKEELKSELDKIRDFLFAIFCDPKNLKTQRLSIDIPFNFVRIGVPLFIDKMKINSELNFESSIGNIGYIETVTDTIDPSGNANTSISLKWAVDPFNTFKPDETPKKTDPPPSASSEA